MADTGEIGDAGDADVTSLSEFLADSPPNRKVKVSELVRRYEGGGIPRWRLHVPDLQLYCAGCGGVRTFGPVQDPPSIMPKNTVHCFSEYICRNCRKQIKVYSLRLSMDGEGTGGFVLKLGEHPRFGPPVPSRAISLIGPDRDLFFGVDPSRWTGNRLGIQAA